MHHGVEAQAAWTDRLVARSLTSRNERIDAETENFILASSDAASAGHHGHSSPRGDGADNLVVAFDWMTQGSERTRPHVGSEYTSPIEAGKQDAVMIAQSVNASYAKTTASGGSHGTQAPVNDVHGEHGVRRLTPLECERLMGWPDNWTQYTADGREISDTNRYRMIGNGVVAPVAEWIGHRLVEVDSWQ